jgi:hypothetical protein
VASGQGYRKEEPAGSLASTRDTIKSILMQIKNLPELGSCRSGVVNERFRSRFRRRPPIAFLLGTACSRPSAVSLHLRKVDSYFLIAPTASDTFIARRTGCACSEKCRTMLPLKGSRMRRPASTFFILLSLVAGGHAHGGHMDKIPEGAVVSEDPIVRLDQQLTFNGDSNQFINRTAFFGCTSSS